MKKIRITARLLIAAFLLPFCACSDSGADTDVTAYSDTADEQHTSVETPLVPSTIAPLETDPETEPEDLPKMITINELMADNESFCLSCSDDWVELYNDEFEDVILDSYYLRKGSDDDKTVPLDGVVVPSKGYAVVKLDENSGFRLPKEGCTLVLRYKKETVDYIEYDDSIGGASWGRDGKCDQATPGFANTVSGRGQYLQSIKLPQIYISEVMSSNKKYVPVEGKFYDWVELYNSGDAAVDLSKYYLSDKRTDTHRYRLPEKELPAGGYTVIYCSDLDREGHAPFKISADGEELFLSDEEGIIDYIAVPADLKQNESYGRNGAAEVYMDEPTPGKENKNGYDSALAAPTASVPSGSYGEAFTVTLSGQGIIYYTLDGTEPDEYSYPFIDPISVDSMTTIRAVCIESGRVSPLTSFFYTVGAEHTYPIVSVAIKEEYLTGEQGVLVNISKEYEHEAYITMYDGAGASVMFSAPCGFKLHGNDSKEGNKQNFQLRFRSKYGLGTLDYPLFDNREYTKFNSLILHGGGEDYKFAGFRDELCTSLVDGTTALNVQACRPVVLYLNGEYRGYYWIRERIDAQYCANRLGVSKESVNLLHTYGTVSDGTNEGYLALLKFCEKNDLRNEENYKYVMDRIDATSLMDWYICRAYYADMDLANVKFFQSTEDDGKWHWCFFDLDWSFYHNNTKSIAKVMPNNGCHNMIRALLKNPEFRDAFIRRCAELLHNVLTEERVLDRLEYYKAEIAPEFEATVKKYRLSTSTWQNHVEMITKFVKDGVRYREMLTSIKDYFGLTDEQMTGYFGT